MPQKPFPPPYDILTELLVECRRSAEVSQEELAERLSIGQSAVSKVERGVQRLDIMELHRWLAAIGGPTFIEFTRTLDDRLRAQTAAETRWRRAKRGKRPEARRPRRAKRG